MRTFRVALVLATMTLVMSATSVGADPRDEPTNESGLLKDERFFLEQSQRAYQHGPRTGSALNMVVVGHNDLDGRGFNADVWFHEGFAYVGHWGFTDWATGNDRFCPEPPNSGVAVIDASDPSNPVEVGALQNPAGTSAEDVVVYTASFGPYAGRDIAAVGVQVCGGSRYDASFPRGLQLWDVTDPTAPVELGFYESGCCARGVHEFEVEDRADVGRTFAYATVPSSEEADANSPSGRQDQLGRGPFRLVDITDPTNPVEVSNWGFLHDGVPPGTPLGCDQDALFGHGAEPSEDGSTVFLSYWDSGFVAVDVSNPATPQFLGRTVYSADADGDGHSSSYDDQRQLLFTADEDFCKTSGSETEKGWGFLRVYDYADRSAPVQIGQYRTPNSIGPGDPGAGDYTIHNPLLVGDTVYASWYTDGVRVIDVSDPTDPVEVANFVPPAAENPVTPRQRFVLPSTTQVWGVVVDPATGLIYISDMNSGLWILQRTDA